MNNFVTAIYSLAFTVFLAESSSASTSQKAADPSFLQSILGFIENNPIFAIIIAVGTIVLGLDRIISFWEKLFKKEKSQSSDKEALRYRKKLLEIIQGDVDQRRKNSLHNLIQIDIRKEEQRQRIAKRIQDELAPEDPVVENRNLINLEAQVFGQEKETEVPKTIDFYARQDIKGRLLILGESGSGKTTELLNLAQELVQGARLDVNKQIPIIFELSAWQEDKSIKDWMLEQLPKLYPGLPKEVAEYWFNNQQVLPLLDGLDELGLVNQQECIVAINEFLENRFETGLVVCCRREEYEQADIELNRLQGAIYLLPLSDRQIQQYLKELNRKYIWNEAIADQPILKELVSKPLFLSILVVAYQGKAISNSIELFEQYIYKQLNNPDNQGIYPPKKNPSQAQIKNYLSWLANRLEEEKETEFLIEWLQTFWLSTPTQKIFYQLIGGLIYGLIYGPILGIIFGLIGGLIYGLTYGMTTGLILGLIYGLIYGLIFGLNVGLIGGLTKRKMENTSFHFPNQGVFNAFRNRLIFGLSVGLIFGLSVGLISELDLGLILGLNVGLIFGLIGGLDSVFRYFILRVMLWRKGYIPWNYAKFLDHAAKHHFIQRVGGRYRFMHDLLRKHFANMNPS